jgi:hypothetical protein
MKVETCDLDIKEKFRILTEILHKISNKEQLMYDNWKCMKIHKPKKPIWISCNGIEKRPLLSIYPSHNLSQSSVSLIGLDSSFFFISNRTILTGSRNEKIYHGILNENKYQEYYTDITFSEFYDPHFFVRKKADHLTITRIGEIEL